MEKARIAAIPLARETIDTRRTAPFAGLYDFVTEKPKVRLLRA
jgi:hypothetical protein